MRDEITTAAQLRVDGGDVIGGRSFVLKFAMLDHGVLTNKQFDDNVCEIGCVSGANETLDDREFAVFFGDDEIARADGGARFAGGGNEKQMYRLRDRLARRDVNERAVLEESSVQRRERVFIGLRVTRQMFFDQFRV